MNLDWIILTEGNHPVPEKLVLAFGINQCGKGRVVRAFYAPKFSVEDSNEYDAAEYSEEKDDFYLKEGWYECNECEEFNWMVDFEITHYMPIPAHPPYHPPQSTSQN